MLLKVEGVVIRAMDYGEGNKIISLYTREAGKLSVMARGAKKIKSRHAAVTQLFTYGQYVVYKSGSMGTLNASEIIISHQKLREDIHLAAYSAYIAEMYERLLGESEPSPILFEQLLAVYAAFEQGKQPDILTQVVEMKMLALSGYMPELAHCVSCQANDVQSEWQLSAALGGLLCPRCRSKDPAAITITERTLKLLRLFQRVDLRQIGSIDVKPETLQQLKHCMRSLMDTNLDVRWKSRSFLEQMEKYDL